MMRRNKWMTRFHLLYRTLLKFSIGFVPAKVRLPDDWEVEWSIDFLHRQWLVTSEQSEMIQMTSSFRNSFTPSKRRPWNGRPTSRSNGLLRSMLKAKNSKTSCERFNSRLLIIIWEEEIRIEHQEKKKNKILECIARELLDVDEWLRDSFYRWVLVMKWTIDLILEVFARFKIDQNSFSLTLKMFSNFTIFL